MQIKVRNKRIGGNAPAFIIAEIGTNHNGNPKLAVKLIKEAARARVDAVKFQVVDPKESYQKGSPSYKIFKKVRLDFSVLRKLKREAEKLGLVFFATPGDVSSLKELLRLNVPLIKISSGCMTNIVLLREAAQTGLPIIMSTGMSYMREVKRAVGELEKNGADKIVVLHCVSQYPAKADILNLNAIRTLKSRFKYPIGYSDHAEGSISSLVAVSLGAKVIEKHFTLSRKLKGPEHKFSMEPEELWQMVSDIRNAEKMMGSYEKTPANGEKAARDKFRRFLVFRRDMKKGTSIKAGDMGIKRLISGKGISPHCYDSAIHKTLTKDVKKDTALTSNLLR